MTRRTTRNSQRRYSNGALETTFQAQVDVPIVHSRDPLAAANNPPVTPANRTRVTFVLPPTNLPQDGSTPAISSDSQLDASDDIDAPALPSTPRNNNVPRPPSPGERFPSPSFTSCSESEGPSSPIRTAPSRTRGTPRAGPHSLSPARRRPSKGPVGNKQDKKAKDVNTFFQVEGGTKTCVFCKQMHAVNPGYNIARYGSKTSTSVKRNHLRDFHTDAWISACDKLGIMIKARSALPIVHDYRRQHDQMFTEEFPSSLDDIRKKFTPEAFVDAIVDFIVADDQSINVIESPKLRSLFLMLRESLHDSDIPHRSTIRARIMEVWDEHLDYLQDIMGDALGKFSFTSDLWSDPNLRPFMAVTAHWIQTQKVQSAEGPRYILTLRADLIAFHHVPGRHTGEHLADAFLHVLNRLKITEKIGWVTLDNASNNDTFMSKLEEDLTSSGISFDKVQNRVRCFPHIINLACKAILAAISSNDFGADCSQGNTLFSAIEGDPIARLRVLIRAIRSSSLRRKMFSDIASRHFRSDVQLLRDVDTRWSSTCLMIERAIYCRPVIVKFLSLPDFEDLRVHYLRDTDWKALEAFHDILSVPHMFQQRLSAEKTPTLSSAIPSFDAIKQVWKLHQDEHTDTFDIVQAGIDKIDDYASRALTTPAYTVAMLLNPELKLAWHGQNRSAEDLFRAKQLFLSTLRPYHTALSQTPSTMIPTAASNLPEANRDTRPSAPRTPGRTRAADGGIRCDNTGHSGVPRLQSRSWADKLVQLTQRPLPSPANSSATQRSLESEIDAYFLDTQTSSSILAYWQENQTRYPTLFSAALDYLPIQGSAVPCERVFSSAKETTTLRRNHISPDLMEALQMLKFSSRTGSVLDFTGMTSAESEIQELGAMTEEEADAHMFGGDSLQGYQSE